MRLSYTERTLFEHDQTLFGLCLGFDFCGEHSDKAIINLAQSLSIPPKLHHTGTLTRKMTRPIDPAHVFFKTFPKKGKGIRQAEETILVVYPNAITHQDAFESRTTTPLLPPMWRDKQKGQWLTLSTQWGEKGFAIRATTQEWQEATHLIYSALLDGELCVGINDRSNPFSGSGLSLADHRLLPQTLKDQVALDDEDQKRLFLASEACGIKHQLEQANLRWHALVPAWYDGNDSNFPINFFLNPYAQSKYNHGWFTVENLMDWINNTGPILKTT